MAPNGVETVIEAMDAVMSAAAILSCALVAIRPVSVKLSCKIECSWRGEKIVFGSRTTEVETRKKTVGYDLVLLPYKDDFPGFEKAMMKRLKTE